MTKILMISLFSLMIVFVFIVALKFSQFKGESHDECDNEENCLVKKIGIKGLKCDH